MGSFEVIPISTALQSAQSASVRYEMTRLVCWGRCLWKASDRQTCRVLPKLANLNSKRASLNRFMRLFSFMRLFRFFLWKKKKKKNLIACRGLGRVVGPLLAARALPLRCAASTMLSSTLLAI
jgi:hypothetical protein